MRQSRREPPPCPVTLRSDADHGLHRALPHVDADGCAHHGFLTLLAATRVAFDGGSPADVVSTLRRDDATDLLTLDLAGARRWFTSFGSCSIDEPLADLRELVSL